MKLLKNNYLVKFVVALFFIGIIGGVLFYALSKPDLTGHLEAFKDMLTTTRQNTFLSSLVIISAIFVLSLSVIGLPIIIFYLFYEAVGIGYTLASFVAIYRLSGGLFYCLFFLVSKLPFIVIAIYFIIFSMRYIAKFLDYFFSKNKEELYKTIVYHFYRFAITLAVTTVNCLFIYFFANKIVSLFLNLL